MNVVNCYTRDQLQEFLLGKLPEEKSCLVAQHLDHCEICEDTIVGLESASDTLVNLLFNQELDAQQDESVSSSDLPEYKAAVERIQNLDLDISSSNASESQPVDQIGEYEIGERIATGGMGSVFRARHMRLEKPVAIKVLPERKMQNADAIARFSREMKIIGQMDHPSMVRATDAGDISGTHFLVMELVEGLDLGRIVRLCGRLSPENAAEVVRSAAIGLHYAHERNVVHRDVKPSNLMLNRDGAVKILDLGLATLGGLHGTVDELTTVGQLMGTLDYMAPEQCGNHHQVDSRTDVYGLGATLYKLLTGSAPYSNPDADTPLKKLKAMAVENPTPILDRRPDLSPELAAVVDKCLKRDPSKRFQSAHELSLALEPFSTGHVLKSLLNSAEKLHAQQREPVSVRESLLIDVRPLNSIPKPKNPIPIPATTKPKMNWFGKSVAAVAVILAAGLLGWGGIIIYLNTIAGQLVIESEIDNIKVSVVQNEKPTKQVQIEHGSKSTRLRAGKYSIEILGETDGLVIDKDRFELKRGERVVVKITKRLATDLLVVDTNADADLLSSDSVNSIADNTNIASPRNELKLAELHNAVEVAKVKLEFATEKLNHADEQFRQGLGPKVNLVQAKMEQQLAALDLDNAKRVLAAYSNQPPGESDFADAPKRGDKSDNQVGIDARSFELIDLEYAVKAAAIKLESQKNQLATPLGDKREVRQDQTNFELAELDYASAKARLDAAKAWIERQFRIEKRDLEQRIAVAQQELNQLQDKLDHSKRLAEKGYITMKQLSSDESKLNVAMQNLDTLVTQLNDMASSVTPSNSTSKPVSPTKETTSRGGEPEVKQPTYEGGTLENFLDVAIQHALTSTYQAQVDRSSIPAIRQLLPLTSTAYLKRLFDHTIAKYENEVAMETQYRVIYSLGLLCDTDAKPEVASMADRLLEYTIKIGNRSRLESLVSPEGGAVSKPNMADALGPLTDSQFDKVQQFLLTRYSNGSLKDKSIGLTWLQSLGRNKSDNDIAANRAVSQKWVPLLIKDTQHENPAIGSFATQVLTLHWYEESNLLDHFYKLLKSPHRNIRHQAVWLLADRVPRLPGLAEHAKKAVQEGKSPVIYANLIEHGGADLIEEYLTNPESGRDVSSDRAGLFYSIMENSKKKQWKDETRNRLAAITRTELDRDKNSTKVLGRAWEAYSALTSKPIPKLYNGHELEYWQRKLAASVTSRKSKLDCLKAIRKLDLSLTEDTLLAIATGLRGGKHESKTVPQDLFVETAAADYIDSGDELRSFLAQLDSLPRQDLPFALFVLSRAHFSRSSAGLVFDFIYPSLESTDPMIRRRATRVLCKLASMPEMVHADKSSRNIRTRVLRRLTEIIESEDDSIEQRMATIEACQNFSLSMQIYGLSKSFDPEKLKPAELVTFLKLALRKDPYGAALLCLQLLAKNPEYLDDEFESIKLDLWYAPSEESATESADAKLIKPIDQILEILDIYAENLVPRDGESPDPSYLAMREAATQTLQERLKTTTGINKKKIERTIERLTREPRK